MTYRWIATTPRYDPGWHGASRREGWFVAMRVNCHVSCLVSNDEGQDLLAGGGIDISNIARVATNANVNGSVQGELSRGEPALETLVELEEVWLSEGRVDDALVSRGVDDLGTDITTQAVRVEAQGRAEGEAHVATGKGAIRDAAATAPAGDDKGQVGKRGGLGVGDVGPVAAEAGDGVEHGGAQHVSLIAGVEGPVPVWLGAGVAAGRAELLLVKVDETAVPTRQVEMMCVRGISQRINVSKRQSANSIAVDERLNCLTGGKVPSKSGTLVMLLLYEILAGTIGSCTQNGGTAYVPVDLGSQVHVGSLEVIVSRPGSGIDIGETGRLGLEALDCRNVGLLLCRAESAPIAAQLSQ